MSYAVAVFPYLFLGRISVLTGYRPSFGKNLSASVPWFFRILRLNLLSLSMEWNFASVLLLSLLAFRDLSRGIYFFSFPWNSCHRRRFLLLRHVLRMHVAEFFTDRYTLSITS